jgi:hypothetical protein
MYRLYIAHHGSGAKNLENLYILILSIQKRDVVQYGGSKFIQIAEQDHRFIRNPVSFLKFILCLHQNFYEYMSVSVHTNDQILSN